MNHLQRPTPCPEPLPTALGQGSLKEELPWTLYRCPELGVTFEAPCALEPDYPPADSPFSTIAQGFLVMPFVFDVNYSVSSGISDTGAEELSELMAQQWAIDYQLVTNPELQKLEAPGIFEAWSLSAVILDTVGLIGSCWITIRHEGRLACLGVSCWTEELRGREATMRLLDSLRRG